MYMIYFFKTLMKAANMKFILFAVVFSMIKGIYAHQESTSSIYMFERLSDGSYHITLHPLSPEKQQEITENAYVAVQNAYRRSVRTTALWTVVGLMIGGVVGAGDCDCRNRRQAMNNGLAGASIGAVLALAVCELYDFCNVSYTPRYLDSDLHRFNQPRIEHEYAARITEHENSYVQAMHKGLSIFDAQSRIAKFSTPFNAAHTQYNKR